MITYYSIKVWKLFLGHLSISFNYYISRRFNFEWKNKPIEVLIKLYKQRRKIKLQRMDKRLTVIEYYG